MNQSIDIEAWRKDGERLWASIQQRKLVAIFWNNPWRRFAVPGSLLTVATVATVLWGCNYLVSGALGVLSLPFVYTAIKYYRIGVRTGGLYSFFSEEGFGIGCDADRLSIPYSSIHMPEKVSPATVNDNYIVLPVRPSTVGVMIERKNGLDSEWDGKPYERGIASVLIRDGVLQVRAYPNEMIVHFFCAIYPLCIFLNSKTAQPSAAPNGGPMEPLGSSEAGGGPPSVS